MKTVYLNVLSRLSTELSTKKTSKFRFASKQRFLAKNLIFKFCFLVKRGITVDMKNVYFNVLSRLSTELSGKKTHPNFVMLAKKRIPGKKFDFQILLLTFKRHHRRYENRLF